MMRTAAFLLGLLTCGAAAAAAEPELKSNQWVKLDKATLARGDAPLVWEPDVKRFMVLGGAVAWDKYDKPHPFDDLAMDPGRGEWENWIPAGKKWGPQFGDAQAPGWKTPYWTLSDAEGNCRPSLIAAGGYYGQYAHDADSKRTYFYVRGSTFCYDAAARSWKDLAPANHPNKALGGELYWSSMCYLPPIKKVLLFGGGNVWTERGDPGTWTYDPAANVWEQLRLEQQPSQRAHSPMVYDPEAKKIVLFGGDRLDQLTNDTWTFDGQKWAEQKPALAPAPRAGHALVWLAGAKKVLLLGGYGYESSWGSYPAMYKNRALEAWAYDAAADRWEFVAAWDKDGPPSSQAPFPIRAAAGADDAVTVLCKGTWQCRLDVSRPDAVGAARLGVKPGAVERRKQFYDPEWYKQKAGPGDPAKTEAELSALAPNTWTLRPQPNRPDILGDWANSLFSPELDVIVRWAGGHCNYGGTAPLVYDVKADRWSVPFAPEMYLEFCASNMGLLDGWSFSGSPWMPGHTCNATGYDPESKSMVYVSSGHSFFFDLAKGKWSRAEKPNPFQTYGHVTTLVNTPKGTIVWTGLPGRETALQLLDSKARTWSKLPITGTLPLTTYDQHGVAYDAKRDRLLLFSGVDKNKGDVMAYDMKTGEAKWLNAAGKAKAGVASRNALYLPEADAVLIGNRITADGGKKPWLLYDCEKNAWFAVTMAGGDPLDKTPHYDLGLMHDPKRKLIWTTDAVNRVHVLKPDLAAAGVLTKLE
jgi:hypothetical protein